MQKKVSVIVPFYNRDKYIGECLESLCDQTYRNFEILAIDDGSTDQSLAICTARAQTDDRIRILPGTHQGVSAARNLGIDAAQGDYLLFVDSDDVIHPRLMEVMLEQMEQKQIPMAGCMCAFVPQRRWEEAKNKAFSSRESEIIAWHGEDAVDAFFTGKSPVGVMGGTMLRRDWVGDTRFRTDLAIGEDYYFNYENLLKGASILCISQSWYLARIHNSNTSWDYGYSGFLTRFRRRELVWKNEEHLGRKKYVSIEKADAYGCYRRCVKKAGIFSEDGKKMRKILKSYVKTIAPDLKWKTRIMFYISLYFPFAEKLLHRRKTKCKLKH